MNKKTCVFNSYLAIDELMNINIYVINYWCSMLHFLPQSWKCKMAVFER